MSELKQGGLDRLVILGVQEVQPNSVLYESLRQQGYVATSQGDPEFQLREPVLAGALAPSSYRRQRG